MFDRRRLSVLPIALCAVACAAPSVASAATPKVTGYTVSGPLTLWTEPSPGPGEPAFGCVAQEPVITATGVDVGSTDAKLYFTGLAPLTFGVSVPWPAALLRGSDDEIVYVRDRPLDISASRVLGFAGGRAGQPSIGFKNIKTKGRYTIAAWYAYPAKIGSFAYRAVKFLPTKSVSFSVVAKPAGSCQTGMTSFFIQG